MHSLGEAVFTETEFTPWSQDRAQGSAWGGVVLTGTDWTLYDAAWGGDTAAMNLARFDTDMLGHGPSDFGIAFLGANDANGSVPSFRTIAAVKNIVLGWCAAGTAPIICTAPPFSPGSTDQKNLIRATNTALRTFAATHGFMLADTYAAMDPTDTGSAVALQEVDGLHPNDAGYTVIGTCIYNTLVAARENAGMLAAIAGSSPVNQGRLSWRRSLVRKSKIKKVLRSVRAFVKGHPRSSIRPDSKLQ